MSGQEQQNIGITLPVGDREGLYKSNKGIKSLFFYNWFDKSVDFPFATNSVKYSKIHTPRHIFVNVFAL